MNLDLDLVLIAPEVRHRVERLGPAKKILGSARAHLGGVHPVLDPQPPLILAADPGGDVTGRVDAIGGLQELVAVNPVVKAEAAPLKPLRFRDRADGDEHAVGPQRGPVIAHDRGDMTVLASGELGDANVGVHDDARGAVQFRDRRADERAYLADHRLCQRVHDGDRAPEGACGGGDLHAEEPGPDDHDV